ncbi:MAG TPA: hypothetical protein VFF00_08700 [Candidatus Elarobacter sp.]|nr:hypothetical protein [Dongiaceae bacterium]HZW54101.1 hypothetical protein [Candidatus Elarobacter sp.]
MAFSSPDRNRRRDPLFDPPGFSPGPPFGHDCTWSWKTIVAFVGLDILAFGFIPMSIVAIYLLFTCCW